MTTPTLPERPRTSFWAALHVLQEIRREVHRAWIAGEVRAVDLADELDRRWQRAMEAE